MKQGLKALTPGNLRFAITQIDPASGSYAGKRQHKPITIVKEVDSASPLYLTALANNEVLTKLDLNFLKTNPQGKTEPYFTITLTNAALVSIVRKPAPRPHSGRQQYTTNELEEIAITFQKIVYAWTKGGITNSDDWNAPV
jgi:type VI secretion system secreted protein Hcp